MVITLNSVINKKHSELKRFIMHIFIKSNLYDSSMNAA